MRIIDHFGDQLRRRHTRLCGVSSSRTGSMLFQAQYAPGVLRLLTADRRIRSASCGSQISSEISSGDDTPCLWSIFQQDWVHAVSGAICTRRLETVRLLTADRRITDQFGDQLRRRQSRLCGVSSSRTGAMLFQAQYAPGVLRLYDC